MDQQRERQKGDPSQAGAARAKPARQRWSWRKRLFVGSLTLLVSLGLGLAIWATLERRGLERRLAALHEGSEPAVPADFNSDPVPDEENAVTGLRAAGRMIDRKAETWEAADGVFPLRLPFTEGELTVLRDAVAANAAALPLVDEAAGKPGVGWGLAFPSPMIEALLPDLGEQRALANLLRYDALLAHVDGDDARALRRVRQLLRLSRVVERHPSLVGHLVALGIADISCSVVADLAPDLRIGSGISGEATDSEVREVIAQLLDETDARTGMLLGLQSDRVLAADSMIAMADGRLSAEATGHAGFRRVGVLKPLVYRNASGAIDHYTMLIDAAARTSDWPTFRDTFAARPTPTQRSRLLYFIANIFVHTGDRYMQQHYRTLGERRMAAVALAVALHRHAHGGAFPAMLSELVPGLLPAVPADPLQPGGKPLGYMNDPARPRVYHVGENGVDDGGRPIDPVASNKDNDRVSDHVMDLLRQPKPLPDEPDPEESDLESGPTPEAETEAPSREAEPSGQADPP